MSVEISPVQISEASNGITVVTESIPGIRSVAVGCWVDAGTRDERPNEAGAAHFLEHLLFKGSERLSARDISETFDQIGAQSNAFTSKEYTCFWARLLDSDLDTGLDLLAEMLQWPAFRPAEIDSERLVVIEEINMNEDDPSDVAVEAFVESLFGNHALERPVLGTRESIREMSPEDIAGFWRRRYGSGSSVVAVAGNAEHHQVVDLVDKYFGEWTEEDASHELAPPAITPRVNVVNRETEQTHIVYGGESINRTDDGRYADSVMHHILGGGMSSRLFQKIREERGLAYAVQSFSMPFAETGAWAVYAGTTPATAHTVFEIIVEEVDKIASEGVSAEELDRAKGHMRGSLALSMEDTNTRMIRIGRSEIVGLPYLSLDERLAKIEAISLDDITEIAQRNLMGPRVIGAVGPFESADFERYIT
jgi:predicted Zn-dependent peptidase